MTPLFSPGVPASRFRPGDSTLLRYALVLLISALLHGGAWQYREWLDHRAHRLPKPKPPIEVILTPVPPPVITPPAPAPPAPVAEPVKPKPVPKAPPAAKAPPAPKPVPPAPKPVAKPAPPKPAPPPKPRPEPPPPKLAPPPPRPKVEPPPKPVRPTRRELEEDPNLPALPKPEPISAQRLAPPPPRPDPRPVRAAPPPREPAPAPPSRLSETRPDSHPAAPPFSRASASDRHANAAASPAPRAPAGAGGPAAGRPATTGSAGGVTESAKANASYLHNPKPEYPALAKRRQWEGRVLLKVRVLANGTVAAVSVDTSSGHDVLDEAALEAVRQWHFVPARRGGQAIESWVNVPINFNLLDSQ